MFILGDLLFDVETNLERDNLQKILDKKVQKSGIIPPLFPSGSFLGEVFSSGFDIQEPVWFLPAWTPKYHGTFEETDHGVVVKVRASNDGVMLNALGGGLASIGSLIAVCVNLYHRDYQTTGIALLGSVVFGAGTAALLRFYCRKLFAGKEKLISILQSK